jgi:hypothetical protein
MRGNSLFKKLYRSQASTVRVERLRNQRATAFAVAAKSRFRANRDFAEFRTSCLLSLLTTQKTGEGIAASAGQFTVAEEDSGSIRTGTSGYPA